MTLGFPLQSGPLAAIDLGSNSFRLELGHISGNDYLRDSCSKEMVKLGMGLDANGALSEDAIQRGLACLARFATEIALAKPVQVRAVATQTLREAQNRGVFIRRAEAILGVPIEVISGDEEARLIFAGVNLLHPSRGRRLVIDIGGRSTEMIVGTGAQPTALKSFSMGSASVTARHFPNGVVTAAGFRQAQIDVRARLDGLAAPFESHHWDEVLASSGTAGALATILQANGQGDGTVTPAGIRWVMERCIEAKNVGALDLPGLKPGRRAVLPGGVAILYAIMMRCGVERVGSAKGALRQGVILGLHARADQPVWRGEEMAPVEIAVHALQGRFNVDRVHSRRVAAAAALLHGHLETRGHRHHELRWAAALHEVGRRDSEQDHHRRCARVLRHFPLPGMTGLQQRRLGALLSGQRGGLKKVEESLSDAGFAHQLLCLRLALICCESRTADMPPLPSRLARHGRTVSLAVPKAWHETHPRTLRQVHKEADRWSRTGALELVIDSAH